MGLLFVVVALGNAAVALALAHSRAAPAALLALVPALLVLLGALLTSRRLVLVLAALTIGITLPFLNAPLPIPLGHALYAPDVVLLLAIGAWLMSRLLGDADRGRFPRSPVLGVPFVLFSLAIVSATLRGHERYGATLFGPPLRLVVYAGIALALSQLDARRLYRGLVVVFYGGTVWMLLNAAYFLATGTSQTDQDALTTGGLRILSQGTAMFMAGSLVLSLLNLEIDQVARRRVVHVAIAGLSLFEIVLAFGRTTFIALALILPILCFFFRQIRAALVVLLPLLVPFLILTALLLPRATPQLKQTLIERVTASPARDPSFQWRVKARAAVWPQVRESPLIGVGFGRATTFTLQQVDKFGFPVAQVEETILQDPHNSYVWLLAGGGLLALASFILIVLAFARDAWIRARRTTDKYERLVVVWAAATLFVFLLNASTGPVFGDPVLLLSIWTLLLLPSCVVRSAEPARVAATAGVTRRPPLGGRPRPTGRSGSLGRAPTGT